VSSRFLSTVFSSSSTGKFATALEVPFHKKKISVKKQETPFSIPSSSLSILERNEGFVFLRHVTKKKMKKR
jgi:hypothetical protein